MRLLSIILAIVVVCTLCTPPAFARIPEPLLGVDWRPDMCADGSPGLQICGNLYNYVVNNIGASAFEYALTSTCSVRVCFISMYTQYMDQYQPQTCTYTFTGGSDEMDSWCVDLFNAVERHTIDTTWPDPGSCEGNCFISNIFGNGTGTHNRSLRTIPPSGDTVRRMDANTGNRFVRDVQTIR